MCKITKNSIVIFFFLIICFNSFSQNLKLKDSIYDLMVRKSLNTIEKIKSGNIEDLKSVNPPKNTWTFNSLLLYKKALESNISIYYDYYLQPLIDQNCYGLTAFALHTNNKSKHNYYYVISISMKVVNEEVIYLNSYLFTEKEALKNWWLNMYGYFNNGSKNFIPKQYKLQIPPPPPNED